MFSAIRSFLPYQGDKYISPAKAGELAPMMEDTRSKAQAARKEFTQLAKAIQAQLPDWELHRTSQWMNQAQILRPHFWAYLQREGSEAEPMMALRLYGGEDDFGLSLELSFVERKKDDRTLSKQAKVLDRPIGAPFYYLAVTSGESNRFPAGPETREQLQAALAQGEVRKVLVKADVDLTHAHSSEAVVAQILRLYPALEAVYLGTRS